MTEYDGPTVPTHADVEQTRQVARDLAEQAVSEEPQRIQSIAEKAGKAAGADVAKRVSRRSLLAVLVVALLVPLLVSVIALNTAVSTRADVANVQVALSRLDQANAELAARGQPPVALPPQATPEQVSAAAITAQVVASLPAAPNADEVASRLQGAVIGQLTGPTFNELARLSADYFRTLPAPPGPTEAQIQAAVNRAYQASPPPPGRDGQEGGRGADGADGAPCLPSNPECVGPRGETGASGVDGQNGVDGVDGVSGAPGRSVTSGPTAVRNSAGVCVWETTYSEAPVFESHLAGDAACPPPVVVPTTPPTTTTG